MKTHYMKTQRSNPCRVFLLGLLLSFLGTNAHAQLSSNLDKFLGNITTDYNVDYGKEAFHTLWNQITPENESKWSSVQGGARGSFSWEGADKCYNYAKKWGFPFKFHTLIWGSQYPSWMDNLSTSEQYKAIVEWMDGIKRHYPTIDMIDVVNEAVEGHAPAPYMDALGGKGVTGYDWIIKAFELAHERWPDAILIYNDYNTFQWQRTQFINLVKAVRDAGAPIDAYGCQSHDLTDMNFSDFKNAMNEIQNNLKMPMYSSEYDIGTYDDNYQEQRYKEQIPYMWEADYCAGITLWGYIYGHTWVTGGNSGIIKINDDGTAEDRPAMDWLRKYMKTDAAKNAKSPFPGMKKEASVYIKPAGPKVALNDSVPITVRARLRTKTIDHVDLYVKNRLYATMTEAPYIAKYKPSAQGSVALKAIVTATDGTTYERLGGFTVGSARVIFNGVKEIPGTFEAEDFDAGQDLIVCHDSDTKNTGNAKSYRTNGRGVDIVTTPDGYALGETVTGEWVEYSVDVKEAGYYSFTALASAGSYGASFNLSLSNYMEQTPLTDNITVPCQTVGDWDTYIPIYGRLAIPLSEGKQIIRVNISGGQCNIDRMTFERVEVNNDIKVTVKATPVSPSIGDNVKITATASAEAGIKEVKILANGQLLETLKEQPYETIYVPLVKGVCTISAIAVDSLGYESKVANYKITVKGIQEPFKTVFELPGIIEAEDFDQGGENISFHDGDKVDEGGTRYRLDNEGVDIVTGNGSHALGYTAKGDWTEYTVNVTQAGSYEYEATVSSGVNGSAFRINLVKGSSLYVLANVNVPQTGNSNWDTYQVVKGKLSRKLTEGNQVIRISITADQCNIDKIKFICTESTPIDNVTTDCDAPSEEPVIYNLSGQRIHSLQKGINIVNGKKIYVK